MSEKTRALVESAIGREVGVGPLGQALRSLAEEGGGGAAPTPSNANPVNVSDTTALPGTSLDYSRADHVHVHGNLAGGTLHAPATPLLAGFMSTTDKSKLDALPAPGAITAGWPAWGEISALMPGDNAATIAVAAPVLFPQPLKSKGGVTVLTANSLRLPVAGEWLITAQVSVNEAGQIAVARQVGGVGLFSQIGSTVVGRATGTNQIVLSKIITAGAGDVIQIWNATGNPAPLTMTLIAGGTNAVSATFRAELMP